MGCLSRASIEGGALRGRGLEIAWLDDPVEVFFLHIQGSGRIRMTDGSVLRVGYAAKNGHPYRSVGKELVRRGINAVSNTHVDFMVGTEDLSIIGMTKDGRDVVVFENGRFAL